VHTINHKSKIGKNLHLKKMYSTLSINRYIQIVYALLILQQLLSHLAPKIFQPYILNSKKILE